MAPRRFRPGTTPVTGVSKKLQDDDQPNETSNIKTGMYDDESESYLVFSGMFLYLLASIWR